MKAGASEKFAAAKDVLSDTEKMKGKGNDMKDGISTISNETINAPISMSMESQVCVFFAYLYSAHAVA